MVLDIELYLWVLLIPAALGVFVALLPLSDLLRKRIITLLCCISCISGILAYPICTIWDLGSYSFFINSAWGEYAVVFGELSSLMISFSSFVFLMVIIHMSRSGSSPDNIRYHALICLLFIASVLTMCADSVFLVLLGWEMVTLLTFMMSYCKEEGARWKFFVITHFGGLMIVSAFIVMYIYAGTPVLSEWSNLHSAMGTPMSGCVLLLLFMGFGTKLGLIPFHVWMPDLYSSAPTHTTTLLSTVCSNVAVLVLFNAVFNYVGIPPEMYVVALIMILVSSITMIWGALESVIQTEAKRILAYSSMENMGVVILCFSVAMLFASGGYGGLTVVTIIAGMLHSINHSVFKSLMFLTVDTVEDSTGTTSMERLGGLSKILPMLSAVALIAVLSMAAIPPFNGFTSEWLILHSVMVGNTAGIGDMELLLPLIVAVLGISGMLAAVSYARMYGFIFLGRPRSDAVHRDVKVSRMTMAPMMALGGMCIALGLLAMPVINALASGIYSPAAFPYPDPYEDYLMSSLDLPLLTAMIVIMICILYAMTKVFRKNVKESETWGCGGELEGDMQYSSMGFTQPLVRVFHPLYGDVAEITDDDDHIKHFRINFKEPFITYLYRPLGRFVYGSSLIVGRIQNGSIQTYLGYILASLVILLLAVRFI